MQDRIHGGAEGDGCRDDFVAGPDFQASQGQVQTGSGGVYRQGRSRTDVTPKFLLKLSRSGTGRQPPRAQRGHHFVDFLVPDGGKVEWNERIRIHSRYLGLQFPASPCAGTLGLTPASTKFGIA